MSMNNVGGLRSHGATKKLKSTAIISGGVQRLASRAISASAELLVFFSGERV